MGNICGTPQNKKNTDYQINDEANVVSSSVERENEYFYGSPDLRIEVTSSVEKT